MDKNFATRMLTHELFALTQAYEPGGGGGLQPPKFGQLNFLAMTKIWAEGPGRGLEEYFLQIKNIF